MKPTELLKVAAIALITSGIAVGCQQSSSSDDMKTEMTTDEDCQGATAEVRNAIYAAKLKNARARNLGAEWEENAKIIAEAEAAAADCENDRAMALANKAENSAAEAITALSMADSGGDSTTDSGSSAAVANDSPYLGGYLVVAGDNLWSIAGQDSIYGNPFQWPLIFKTNAGQIKDADLIFPGQYFYIPKARGSERAAAIEHAKNRGAWILGEVEASDLNYLAQ
jgi:nucleoid-associated protein YgaU